MKHKNSWSEAEETEFRAAVRKTMLKEFEAAEKRKKPQIRELFTDVYDKLPQNLVEQEAELYEMIKKYPQYYPISEYAGKDER